MDKQYDFNEVDILSAVAMGTPGKRTFFLAIGKRGEWLRVWLEKQDLQALGLAISQLLFSLSREIPPSPSPREETPARLPSDLPGAEFDLREVALGYEDGRAVFDVTVETSGPQNRGQSVLNCRPTIAMLKRFAVQAVKICAAGRPICPLCGGPIDPEGHSCPSRN